MKAAQQVYGFPYGQMDPEFAARRDLKAYYLGGRTVRNLAPRAAGGLDRRPGLAWFAEIAAAAGGCRLTGWERTEEAFYLLAITPGQVAIWRDGVYCASVVLPYAAADLAELDWATSWDTMILFHRAYQPRKLMWGGDDATWTLSLLEITNPPTRQYGPDTIGDATPSGKTGTITVTSTGADFVGRDVGQIVHLPTGHGSITAITSDTQASVRMIDPLTETALVAAGSWSIEDPVWSDERGWPECGSFDGNGRLMLGWQNSVSGSRIGQYFDFMVTSGAETDDALDVAIDDNQANRVRALFNADHMVVITSGGPFSVPDAPSTPSNFYLKRINRVRGARIRPAEVDGVVAFVSDGADGAYSSVFELAPEPAADSRYSCRDLAMMASSVIKNPVGMAARRGTGTNSANYLFVVNEDGTIGVLHSRREQQVTAWTPWDTDGALLDVAVAGNSAWFLIRRTIAGTVRYFLEKLDPDHLGDCSIRQSSASPKSVWTGFGPLAGHTVSVVADGAAAGTVTVGADGSVTLDQPASSIEVGLPFSWVLEPMPVEKELSDGTMVGQRARIWKAVVQVQDTVELWVDGQRIGTRRFEAATFDAPPPSVSDEIVVRMLGRRKDRTIRIEGSAMAPATILGVTLFVSD